MICLTLLSERTGKKERKNAEYIPCPKVVLGDRTQVYRWGWGANREEKENLQCLFPAVFRGSVSRVNVFRSPLGGSVRLTGKLCVVPGHTQGSQAAKRLP